MPSADGHSNDLLQIISRYMKDHRIKRNNDLGDLFLGNCAVKELCDLERFRYLRHIWLHGNRLTRLSVPSQPRQSFIHANFRVAELYLHDNDIKSIYGMLSHLPCLKVLMLQKNQLVDLDETTLELKPMMNLQVLNMLYNPLTQVKGYRLHLIHHCPSIKLLDRQGVTQDERKKASQRYEEKRNAVKSMIAFGRKTDRPPIFDAKPLYSTQDLTLSRLQSMGSTSEQQSYEAEPPQKSLQQLIKERIRKKSMLEYTMLDWSIVPTREKRIMGEVTQNPRNITVTLR